MSFRIDVGRSDRPESSGAWKIAIRAGTTPFTHLLRARDNRQDDYIIAPPTPLAFWLTDNWWRLRWECIPIGDVTSDWRLAHDLSSVGGGYAWPRLEIWGEDERVGLMSKSDPRGAVGPVRYLTDALAFVPASEFERECDEFLQNAVDEYVTDPTDRVALRAQIGMLRDERDNSGLTLWRRLEARLGFDPDEAPNGTIESLMRMAEQYGQDNVDEAATAMPGGEAANTLTRGIEAAHTSRVVCDFRDALRAWPVPRHLPGIGQISFQDLDDGSLEQEGASDSTPPSRLRIDYAGVRPWQFAESATHQIRQRLGYRKGPLRNKVLADLFGTTSDAFRAGPVPSHEELPYGLRMDVDQDGRNRIVLRSRWPHDRRFEAARALGDVVWTGGSAMGLLAASKTARQKFQRAFAQSLLCPYDDLIEYIGTISPTEGDIAAAARNFHVSERVVQTVLVNKRVMERGRLGVFASSGRESLEELVDAA